MSNKLIATAMFLIVITLLSCGESELESRYAGKKIPYSLYSEIGQPQTLSGTDNEQWVAYFPKGDFTVVSDKKTDIVKFVYSGKHPL
jgi:hypothetical protein